jgi:hypothetical protein
MSELQFSALVDLKKRSEKLHARMHGSIYRDVGAKHLDEIEISTLLNVSRELYVASHSLLAALADALLDAESASDFNSIPATG